MSFALFLLFMPLFCVDFEGEGWYNLFKENTEVKTVFKGKVKHRKSGKPLCGIKVTDGLNIALTDENGCYELPGWERARVISVGLLTRRHDDWYIYAEGHQGDFDFLVEPVDVSSSDFCFLHNSDIEVELRDDSDYLDFMRAEVRKNKPAFFANTGDMCRDGIYRMYLAMNSETLNCPVRFTIGNHDFCGERYGEEIYERLYGPTWYSFDCGDVHFVALSIGKGDKPSGYKIEDQFHWLKNDLALMDRSKRIIVLDHDFCKWDPFGHHVELDGVSVDFCAEGLLAWVYGHFHINKLTELNGVFDIGSARPDSAGIDSSPAAIRKINISGHKLTSDMIYFVEPAWEGDAPEWRTQLEGHVEYSAPVEVDGDIRIGKETVSAEPLRTGAVSNVADIVLPLGDPVEVIFDGSRDKLGGIAFVRHGKVVLILMAVCCFWEVFQDLTDEILLRFRYGKRLPGVIDLVHIVPLGNVFDEIAVVLFRSGLDVPPFQNHFCHMRYPLLSVGCGHQERVMDSPQR